MKQRVVVVGYCASGKSTVVAALRERGIDALAVAQEHSVIHDLWNHPNPDVVVFLDVDIEEIRKRRDNPGWPEWIYDLQHDRLAEARERADLVVDTSHLSVDEIIPQILELISQDG
ncbi:MAG TPA: hypothetical protein VKZ96_17055 [Thermomicrobiales bacterium]|nr:hypothetical protein [Thermomicrobiales bacterium]